jgi:hypothetical protein
MKKKETFEKNIEKLMKLTAKTDQPTEAFVEKLIEDAMGQLKTPQQKSKLNEKTFAIKLTFKHTAAIAAALIAAPKTILACLCFMIHTSCLTPQNSLLWPMLHRLIKLKPYAYIYAGDTATKSGDQP